jgi:hypothetical protein
MRRWQMLWSLGVCAAAAVAIRCSSFEAAPSAPSAGQAFLDGSTEAASTATGGPAFEQSASIALTYTKVAQVRLKRPTTEHDALVVAVTVNYETTAGIGPPLVTDDRGTVFARPLSHSVDPISSYLFIGADVAEGATEVAVEFTQSVKAIALCVHEYSGVRFPSPLEDSRLSDAHCEGAMDCMATSPMKVSAGQAIVFGYAVAGGVATGTDFARRESGTFEATFGVTVNMQGVAEDRIVVGPGTFPALATKTASYPTPNVILGAVLQGR